MSKESNSKRALSTSLVSCTIFILFWIIFIVPSKVQILGRDFLSYYLGTTIIKDGKIGNLYDINYQLFYQNKLTNTKSEKVLPYIAPPSSSYIYYPFNIFGPMQAYKAFVLFQLIALSACIFILIKELKVSNIYICLLCSHPIVMINIFQGQPSILILLFLLLSLVFFKKERYTLAGITLSLLLIKPQLFPIIFFLIILVKNPKFKIGTILGSLSIFLLNLLMYGKNFLMDYLKFLSLTNTPYYGSHIGASHTIKSLFELIDNVLKTNFSGYTMFVSLILIGITGLILLTKGKVINTKKIDIEVIYGLSILISVPLSTHLLNHDLILLALPVGVIAASFNSIFLKSKFWIFYFLTWTYYLMNISFFYNKSIIGVLLLLGFIYYYSKNLEGFSKNHT